MTKIPVADAPIDLTDELIVMLGNVVELCHDSERSYRAGARRVTNGDLKALFVLYANRRAQFASELQHELIRLGAGPFARVGGAGHLEELRLVGESDEMAVLRECEQHDAEAIEGYEEALALRWPADVHSVLARHGMEIRDAHDCLRALRDAMGMSLIA